MSVEMKKAQVKSEKKPVGEVSYPDFDTKNPAVGLAQIQEFDWKGAGYQGWEDAVVTLTKTQYATNLKNELRAKANPKLTKERLSQLVTFAMAKLPASELQALQASGEAAILAKVEELKVQITKDFEDKAREAAAAGAVDDDEEDND